MNGEGGIGRAEEDLAYLRGDFVSGFDFGESFLGGYYPDISVGPFLPQFAAYSQLPAVRALPPIQAESEGDPEASGNGAVLQEVPYIDPESGQYETVFESDAPQGVYQTNREPMSDEDWDRYYDEYVILNTPSVPEVSVPIDWGRVIGGAVGGLLDPFGAGRATTDYLGTMGLAAPVVPAVAGPPGVQRVSTAYNIDPRTGRPVCKRRRRRRLLTDGDFNDLMRISTLPNKDIVKIALAKAVGR